MKIICVSEQTSQRVSFTLNIWSHLIIPSILVALLFGGLLMLQKRPEQAIDMVTISTASEQRNASSSSSVSLSAQQKQEIEFDILSKRLGILEAESLRLNAFGSRIVKMARMDPAEFAFDDKPSQGGVNQDEGEDNAGYGVSVDELMEMIEQLEKQLFDQRHRLEGMLHVLNGRILDREVKPSGMPVRNGYISSSYGFRRDPFTGKKRLHKGIDFAGKLGTDIAAVGSGIVSYVGKNGGYGKTIEIDHGGGIISRYAHLHRIGVKRDQVVKKSQVIAQLGSTGRSTGPHLHLEVIKDGVQQDPAKYF
ncbi:MAG: Peptidase M23 [uncultured Thiotrichaceae bacterium]|uniref:Peptidase M23 n=1 Tax=uncultured Thiotrichaceae bacterium TaxID=298394 RepID=A0A6S6TNC3_9GAMM|nr:MAG: Peptidase M23 [uncultured Thiotrichaceae bacterium]